MKILKNEPYEEILDNIQAVAHKNEILEQIDKYRTIESRDMSATIQSKITGLKKYTCLDFSKVYDRTIREHSEGMNETIETNVQKPQPANIRKNAMPATV
jgi:hypothetical protein